MKVPLSKLLTAKEEELKAFRFAVEKFCEEFVETLNKIQNSTGRLEVVSFLAKLIERASFTAELEDGHPALKLKISFPEEELEYETKPIVSISSWEGPQLLMEGLLSSIRGFIEFLLENFWRFYSLSCEKQSPGKAEPEV